MLPCYVTSSNAPAISIFPVVQKNFIDWFELQPLHVKEWVNRLNFTGKPQSFCWIPRENASQIQQVLIGLTEISDFWPWGNLPLSLPEGIYEICGLDNADNLAHAVMAWGLGAYQFTRYKKAVRTPVQLLVKQDNAQAIFNQVKAIYRVRDLINTPSEDMGPAELAEAAREVAEPFGAEVQELIGEELLEQNYPGIHRVGRASTRSPRLIDLRWGDSKYPRITLVGKGVCFDSGGLDIKSSQGMALMKKDMAGAAHVLGLAHLIMSSSLPVSLRVLIPAVDNVISGNAYRPGDVIIMRNGLSVEVNNTDAEGRLVVADALAEAASEKPALLLDFTTLTGAARVALGPDIAAIFCNNADLSAALLKKADQVQDPLLEFPLYTPYRKYIESQIADLSNAASIPYGGAMTAALFLNEFVPAEVSWAHFDLMAWNLAAQPGRPEGGEAMALRAVWRYLLEMVQG